MDTINILIIEDTPEESNALSKVLLENNYNIVGVARTFKDALTLFYNEKIDIAIIDVFLDGKPDGIAFAEAISKFGSFEDLTVLRTGQKYKRLYSIGNYANRFSKSNAVGFSIQKNIYNGNIYLFIIKQR